jgi:hypothetical protein
MKNAKIVNILKETAHDSEFYMESSLCPQWNVSFFYGIGKYQMGNKN